MLSAWLDVFMQDESETVTVIVLHISQFNTQDHIMTWIHKRWEPEIKCQIC